MDKGYSRQMAELSVSQGVTLGWLHHMIYKVIGAKLVKVDGETNVADVHTKPLGADKIVKYRAEMGIVSKARIAMATG